MKKRVLQSIILALAVILALPLTSCNSSKRLASKSDKVGIVSVDGVKASTGGVFKVRLTVRNDMGIKFKLTEASATASANNKSIANLTLLDEVTVPKRCTTQVELPLRLQLNNPLHTIRLIKQLKEGKIPDLNLSAEGKIKAMGTTYPIKRSNISLKDLLKQTKQDTSLKGVFNNLKDFIQKRLR